MAESANLTPSNVVEFVPANPPCRFCMESTVVEQWNKKIIAHLIVTMDEAKHVHVHGPINDGMIMKIFVDAINHHIKEQNGKTA